MLESVREAGWGILPVALFGAVALILSVMYARDPARRYLPLVVGFSIATLIGGCLGTITGFQTSVDHVDRAVGVDRWLVLVGLKEALHCLVAACLVVSLVALVTTIGGYRRAAREDAAAAPAGA